MLAFYNIIISLYRLAIGVASLFQPKAKLFLQGRKNIFNTINNALQDDERKRIWIHCASLGEFEQARPLIEKIKNNHSEYALILTFFSPSGYEVQRNYAFVDYIFYLPIDTKKNAAKFIDIANPQFALFVKYEFWFHYLNTLSTQKIPAILFSAVFQERHPFFKWYGGFYRKMLQSYRHIFVQDIHSKQLLKDIAIENVSVAGDTRYDRVAQVLHSLRPYPKVEIFKGDKKLIVAGSTWQDDEKLLEKAFNVVKDEYKLLIVPHETDDKHIAQMQKLFRYDCCLWNEEQESLSSSNVCIVNEVGHLAYLYRYADIAWVGGGFTDSGVHNVLEPAVFGIPVFFGENYERYLEATDLINAGGGVSLMDAEKLVAYLQEEKTLLQMGNNAEKFVLQKSGATEKIFHYLNSEKCFFNTATKF